jgi:tetratricopeptide (TPR) repeat protein
MRRLALISLLLVVLTVAAYWSVRRAEFTNFDDTVYVTHNENVFRGLTRPGVVWAFTTVHGSNWHPLTWLSHMLDCQVFGDKAGGHHLVSVGLHAANAVLLFLLLRRMTGAVWRSAFVAALFALHPLHVESVAWISERKDVLSTFFGLNTLGAYVRYVEPSKVQSPKSKVWYGLALVCYALGLMSKPMLVTVPFVMLLLDFWPLRRFHNENPQSTLKNLLPLLREKLPFFGLAVLSSGVTYWAQKTGGAVVTMQKMTLADRLANASVSYLEYLSKTFWPAKLAAFYPFPTALPEREAILGALVLAGATVLALALARRAPYVAVGWLWFGGTLVPVIGLVQVGGQAMADRYTYVPLVGLFVAVAWGVTEATAGWRWQRLTVGFCGGSLLAACFVCTQAQARYWQNSITLFSHAIQVTGDNALAQHNLGHALSVAGKQDEALEHLDEALRIKPGYPQAYFNRGNAYGVQGKVEQAIADYREAIHYKPDYEQAYCNLGKGLALEGKLEEARTNFLEALRCKPDYAEAHTKLGNVLALEGRTGEALEHLRAAVRIQPDYDEGQYYLGAALAKRRQFREAAACLRAAIKANPGYASALNDLGWLLATCSDAQVRNVPEAIGYARRACKLTGNTDPMYLDTLAVAESEAGQFTEASALTEKAIAEATAAGDSALAAQLQTHLDLYRTGRAYTQGSSRR